MIDGGTDACDAGMCRHDAGAYSETSDVDVALPRQMVDVDPKCVQICTSMVQHEC